MFEKGPPSWLPSTPFKEVLEENLDINPESVNEDSTFDSLGIDSLDMVELICDQEEKCDVDFGEPEGLKTVGELVEQHPRSPWEAAKLIEHVNLRLARSTAQTKAR